jgi:hypothetical protein
MFMKKNIAKKISALALLTSLTSCASMTNTQKTLSEMAGAAVVGGVVGAVLSPKDDNSSANAALGAGISAAVMGVIGLTVNNDQDKLDLQSKQIEALHKEIEVSERGRSTPIASSTTSLEKNPPKEFQGLIKNGGWEFSEMDDWEKVSETEAVHKDKRAVLIPAQFNFGK